MLVAVRMSKFKILIVDDDPKISSLMAAVLEKAGGYETRQENRSFAALATARTFAPDLVTLDVDMPGKDGGEIAAELRGDPVLQHVPVVFITSLIKNSDLRGAPAISGGNLVIAKPVLPKVLLETINRLARGIQTTAARGAVATGVHPV